MVRPREGRKSHLMAVPDSRDELRSFLAAAGRGRGRGPRRDAVVGYELRIELGGVTPTVWRCVVVPSTTMLDELHDVVQDAMGWVDSHLHEWRTAADASAPAAERYGMRLVVDEGDHPIDACESDVRIDEVLAERGDTLYYEYDFGDRWEHRVVLAHVVDAVPTPLCLDGERACPPEDCGGVPGYEHLRAVLGDPRHPDHEALRTWAGDDFDPDLFDLDAASAALTARAEIRRHSPPRGTALAALLARIPALYAPSLYALLLRARLSSDDERVELPARDAEGMTLLAWLLRRTGADGVPLTSSGYLSPAVVAEAREVLGPRYAWAGKSTRELDNPTVLAIRELAQDLGLVRKYRGKLVCTKRAAGPRSDPDALVDYIAARLPLGADEFEREAGLMMLLSVAADADGEEQRRAMLEAATALGWRMGDGEPLTAKDAVAAAGSNRRILHHLGVDLGFGTMPERRPAVVRELARRALRGPSR
ncbi:plasmid pRiA4b ORF-3 family protein [Rhodococcus chondri]|uniref:Plasmid pRiA4b ORF-3 family protein n=1 Tax=Rhodococcus chondri TaxID=3065941 RepID=A0ABU7K0C2_9NOCA|nr:plasmid pRiA4b ORF-3 family protein [Rhodococcus sp. CC-R104]MEE2035264.1 plasmid pRiA4b ORF-3 family protein [Rhodococcus sp. CC-R104]